MVSMARKGCASCFRHVSCTYLYTPVYDVSLKIDISVAENYKVPFPGMLKLHVMKNECNEMVNFWQISFSNQIHFNIEVNKQRA